MNEATAVDAERATRLARNLGAAARVARRYARERPLGAALALALAGCATAGTPSVPSHAEMPLAVPHSAADPDADPRWHDASESLEHISARCDERRGRLERRAAAARAESGVASVISVVVTIIGELADTTPRTTGVEVGTARCIAPAGPTSTLPPAQQASAIPCGGMAAAGGGGPIPQRAIQRQLTLAELTEAMRLAIEDAMEWLDERRATAAWSDDESAEWDRKMANLRSLCIEPE